MFIEHLLSDLIIPGNTLLSFGTVLSPPSGLGTDAHGCRVRLVAGPGRGLAVPASIASPTAGWGWGGGGGGLGPRLVFRLNTQRQLWPRGRTVGEPLSCVLASLPSPFPVAPGLPTQACAAGSSQPWAVAWLPGWGAGRGGFQESLQEALLRVRGRQQGAHREGGPPGVWGVPSQPAPQAGGRGGVGSAQTPSRRLHRRQCCDC